MPRISTDNYDTVASWNGSQDLFIVEQPDGTKVATPEQIKQYVLGNSIDDIYSVMGQNGAKNLIPYPYYESSYTENGITWTVNADGTITADGTAEANEVFVISYNFKDLIKEGTDLILSGCPTGGSASTYKVGVDKYVTSSFSSVANDFGEGKQFEMPTDGTRVRAFITIYSGTTVTNLIFKPMLRLAADTDNTYQPYAKTNKQLTEVIGDLSQTGVTGDSVAAQLGDVNDKVNIVSNISPGPNLTMSRGVYVKIGTLVIVNLVCRATGAITPDSVICNVPANWMANAPLNIFQNAQLVSGANCRIFNGSVRAGANISSGTEFCIQGSYISTT